MMGKIKSNLSKKKPSQLPKLKATGYSIILGRNSGQNTDADKANKKLELKIMEEKRWEKCC